MATMYLIGLTLAELGTYLGSGSVDTHNLNTDLIISDGGNCTDLVSAWGGTDLTHSTRISVHGRARR